MKIISIIIPFKNTQLKWLNKLIESLKNQTNKNFEVIFVDDNSNNVFDYKKIIEKNGFCYIKNNKTNNGVGNLRDFGITQSVGEYIWFIDSDDWIANDAVDYLLKSFDKYQDIDLIMFDYIWVYNYKKDSNKSNSKKIKYEFVTNNIASKKNTKWFHNNYQTDWRVCFKKDFLIQNNIVHNNSTNVFEDVYFGLIWKVIYKKILLTSKKIYYYNRLNVSSTLNNYNFDPSFLISIIKQSKQQLIKEAKFNEIWYFYVLNWAHAFLKNKNKIDINEFFNNFDKLKYLGFGKQFFQAKLARIKNKKK